jgi:putative oxidoreductase
MSYFFKFYSTLVSIGNFLQPFFLLAIRLFWGWQFFKAGFTKFDDMAKVAAFFGKAGIPLPTFNAYLVAIVEMFGGLFLFFGYASRLVAIPLMITMLVALLATQNEAVLKLFSEPSKILAAAPFTFLMAAATIFVFGPGVFSLDRFTKAE